MTSMNTVSELKNRVNGIKNYIRKCNSMELLSIGVLITIAENINEERLITFIMNSFPYYNEKCEWNSSCYESRGRMCIRMDTILKKLKNE